MREKWEGGRFRGKYVGYYHTGAKNTKLQMISHSLASDFFTTVRFEGSDKGKIMVTLIFSVKNWIQLKGQT